MLAKPALVLAEHAARNGDAAVQGVTIYRRDVTRRQLAILRRLRSWGCQPAREWSELGELEP